jgi:hypothetical protein
MLVTDGQREAEGAAFVRAALGPDVPAMSLNDALGDIETEPYTSRVALFDLLKALEHGLEMGCADTPTGITHGEAQLFVFVLETDDDTPARWRKFDRVANQIREHLQDASMIELGRRPWTRRALNHQRNTAGRGLSLERIHYLGHDLTRISEVRGNGQCARLDAGDVYEIPDEAVHSRP